MADHRLMIIDQLCASLIEFRVINIVKMLCEIFCGKFRNAGSADMGMHSRTCARAQGHDGNFSVRIASASILIIRKIVFLRIFAILRDFPISIHLYYPFLKQNF